MTRGLILRALGGSVFAAALSGTALAVPTDGELTLGDVGLPVYMKSYDARYHQPTAVYPISAAHAPAAGEEAVRSVSTKDVTKIWTLEAWTLGRTISEQPQDARIGDFCADIPLAADDVDWVRTREANAAAVADGRVIFNFGADSAYKRVIFTAGGATEIVWVSTTGEQVSQTYSITSSMSARPYRVYATRADESNTAAFIDLSGKFVKFFGDPALLRSECQESAPGVSNVVYGIDFDPSRSKFLTVRYRVNETTGAIDCPQGQFVLAYYDTETKDHLIAHVVVEICPPNVTTLYAEVGDCLKPVGGGYGTERLYSTAAAGLQREDNDPYSPYLEQYSAREGDELTDRDHGKLFAVAPTDVTTSPAGMAMPWKADVYWQTEDPMKTRWTFEHDWYLVSWPAEPLRVVVAPTGAPTGCPFLVPTNYMVQAGFKMPATISAAVDAGTGEVKFNGQDGDRILLMIANGNGVGCPSYLPVELTDYRRATVATPWTFEWPVGIELTPRIGLEAGEETRAMSERVDDNLSGFIYEPESKGRNWNPRLYHRPRVDAGLPVDLPTAEDVRPDADRTTDPYKSLKSAIYGVNESVAKIQVWWRANFKTPRMSAPVTYPALVQNYRVSWASTMAPGFLPKIALSSQLGSSDTNMFACSGRSLLLVEKTSTASVDLGGRLLDEAGRPTFVGFSCYISPDGVTTTGALARVCFGDRGSSDAGIVEARLRRGETNDFEVVFEVTGDGTTRTDVQPVKIGEWNDLSVQAPATAVGCGVTAVYGTWDVATEESATFVVLDRLALWYGDAETDESVFYNFTFSDTDLTTLSTNGTVRTAKDAASNTLLCHNCAMAGLGVSKPFALRLKAEGDAKPEIYYENESSAVGYNPNEEHAFVQQDQGDGAYTAWALRCDLNTDETSKPVVLVMYPKNGKGCMQAYVVAKTSDAHARLEGSAIVGNTLLPPKPIRLMAGCQTSLDKAVSAFDFEDNAVVYRDRKNTLWARRDGIASAKYGYPMQAGFFFPSLETQPRPGTPIAWLACEDVVRPDLDRITNANFAVDWQWTVRWPEVVPELRLGQVHTKAALGLPEVWNASSMAVCYPNPPLNGKGVPSGPTVVTLIDPTVVQKSTSALPVNSSFPDEYGFVLGPAGTTFLREGKYCFTGLPPSISDRFYVTVDQGKATMNLIGKSVEKEAGGSYLELNVLTDDERAAIKKLCTLDPNLNPGVVANWNAAADSLAVTEVEPSPQTNFGAPVKSVGRESVTLAFPSKDVYEKWVSKMATDSSPVHQRFQVKDFTFSDLGTAWRVVAGQPIPGVTNVAFATWHEDKRNRELLGPTRRALAKRNYEAAGLNTYLGTEWDSISPSRFSCTVTYVEGHFTWETSESPAANTYRPRDHYALVANGTGAGYVTLIENDNPDPTQVSEGLPVKMSVIKVVPELYTDGIAVLSDTLNKLSEKLTLLYRTPLGSAAKGFEFEWSFTTPQADGTVPPKGSAPWQTRALDTGLVSMQLGLNGINLQDYVNTYYTLRYRPLKDSAAWKLLQKAHPDWTDEQFWSAWSDEQLAEGWLQRVFNGLTPFAQRVEDFYANASDIGFSMLEQIGKPYQGDVALNNDNLSQVGLLELYQTVFNRAESLLIAAGGNNIDMSKQLILAQTRLGEFYTLLGSEAYSDAKNPLIAAGPDGQTFASGTFSFANQVQSLLDEELALLRGRTAAVAFPRMTEAPLYNRLAWNLTKGLTEGEPAYVANYGIRARNGVLDVNCAAVQYPQGHGDAWGHFLSALKGYYRLLRNPYFDWTTSMSEMLMDQKLMNVDYQDEQKFADAAVRLVQAGTDAMDLTLRKAYKENSENVTAGYFDANAEQAFGYGEWATRTGMAAAYSWMTANALLPTNDAPYRSFTDKGIMKITRTTATQLPVLASAVSSLESKLNGFEAGSNPLGLSENAIPFDIDPDRLAAKESHFEQILERAEQALANCDTVLGYAGAYGARLAQIAKDEESSLADRQAQEEAFNNRLIAIYGTPYPGDIGAGGTYPQGYDGPDIYNYTYMDLSPYGLDGPLQTHFTNTYTFVQGGLTGWEYKNKVNWRGETQKDYEKYQIHYIVNEGGIRLKPETITGTRRTEGSIQTAYRNYINAYLKAQQAVQAYDGALAGLKSTWSSVEAQKARYTVNALWKVVKIAVQDIYLSTPDIDLMLDLLQTNENVADTVSAKITSAVPATWGVGMSITTDPRSMADAISQTAVSAKKVKEGFTKSVLLLAKYQNNLWSRFFSRVDAAKSIIEESIDAYDDMAKTMVNAAESVNNTIRAVQPTLGELSAAEAAYRAEVAKGEQIQRERALWRQQVSNHATEQRYLDMYNRVQRNIALTKYTTAFDTAQRYVWELAKVYDYETGLLSSNPQSGKQFLADIIATRALGQKGVSISSGTTDGGLYDVINRMKANWSVLKPRLGINNPDKPAKWFSLRRELFRIKDGAEGDRAWRKELEKYRVDNILTDAEFRRHCQPPASSTALVLREPGYVIPFSTSIDNALNFFGKDLQAGDGQFSSADYTTKIAAAGVDLVGLDQITNGGALEPNIYLVPVGLDYMRSPAGTERALLSWNVVDQVMPLPYAVGSTELNDPGWISTFSGLDGTSDSTAVIRRHSTMRAGADFKSTRLVGRSVWNDRWIIVIPASALDADRDKAMKLIEESVRDIRLGIKAYARQGN